MPITDRFIDRLHGCNISITCFLECLLLWEELDDNVQKDLRLPMERSRAPVRYRQIKDMYNDICKSLPAVTKMSAARQKAIRGRFADGYTYDDFSRLFEKAQASAFLAGKNTRGWKANFDWLIRDANMAKVLDGNYDDIKPVRQESSYDLDELEKFIENPIKKTPCPPVQR